MERIKKVAGELCPAYRVLARCGPLEHAMVFNADRVMNPAIRRRCIASVERTVKKTRTLEPRKGAAPGRGCGI